MRPLLFLIVLYFFNSTLISAQSFISIVEQNRDKTFAEIDSSVQAHFDTKGRGKGTGFKQYKKWRENVIQRILPNGHLTALSFSLPPDDQNANFKSSLRLSSVVSGNWSNIAVTNATKIAPTINNQPAGGCMLPASRINSITADPSNSQILYACSARGGLWKSTNGGTSWALSLGNLPTNIFTTHLAIDPNSSATSRIMYLLTGDGLDDIWNAYPTGIYKSTDGGTSWTKLTLTGSADIHGVKLAVHPTNSQIVIAAMRNGLWVSTNAGSTWTQKIAGTDIWATDIEFKPGTPSTIYATTRGKLYRSTDNGATWKQLTSNLPSNANYNQRTEVEVCTAAPNNVYVLYNKYLTNGVTGTFDGMYLSTDGGTSFVKKSGSPNIFGYNVLGQDNLSNDHRNFTFGVSPTNPGIVFAGAANLWKSADMGATWTINGDMYYYYKDRMATGKHYTGADMHQTIYYGGKAFQTGDAGIYVSANDGGSWDLLGATSISEVYKFDIDPNNPNRFACGLQEGGATLLESGVMKQWGSGDFMKTFINPINPNNIWAAYYGGQINRYDASIDFAYWFNRPGGVDGNFYFYAMDLNTNDYKTVYVGIKDVFKTTDLGASWINLTNQTLTDKGQISSLTVCPTNGNIIFVVKDAAVIDTDYHTEILYRSTDGGNTWTSSPSLNAIIRFPKGFAFNPENSNIVWTVGNDYRDVNGTWVWKTLFAKSTNGGATWTEITSSTLPDEINAYSIVYQNGTNDVLYIATDAGVYVRDNSSTDWQSFNTGLPKMRVSDLKIQYNANKLIAGTYGRGLWSTDLYANSAGIPTISITAPANNATVTRGSSTTITATTTDSDANISKVEFFDGITSIGTDASSPYSISWAPSVSKDYYLVAKVTDAKGNITFSVPVKVTAGTNQNPTVSITAPANNATFTTPATVNITANAADADGTIAKVEFYQGATKLGEDLTSPYSYSWTNVANGNYSITAKAYDNTNAVTTSSAIAIVVTGTNQNPTVSITAPANNATFTAPATVNITANAADADGTIAKVEFYQGTTKLGEDLTSPYSYSWTNVANGNYSITAKAYDNINAVTTSSAIAIVVGTTPVTSDFCFEAESGSAQSTFAPFQVLDDGTASGGKYIVVPSGGNQALPPTNSIVTFTFNISTAASYNYWVRIIAPTSNDNSMYYRTDTDSYQSYTPGTYTSWTWKRATTKTLTVGSHSFSIARNEDGLKVDNVLISKSSSTPVGTGCPLAPVSMVVTDIPEERNWVENKLTLAPNPSSSSFYLTSSRKNILSMSVVNALGVEVNKFNNLSSGESLEFGKDLGLGVYTILVKYEDEKYEYLRILKVK